MDKQHSPRISCPVLAAIVMLLVQPVSAGQIDIHGPPGSTCTAPVMGDPRLGLLQDNGCSTWTMLPDAGSAAIDSGDNGNCPLPGQRGISRPQEPHCDIGAVEVTLIDLDRIFC